MSTLREGTSLLMAKNYGYSAVNTHPWDEWEAGLARASDSKSRERAMKARMVALAATLTLACMAAGFFFCFLPAGPGSHSHHGRRRLKGATAVTVSVTDLEALRAAKVIPDVLDEFTPTVEISVVYKDRTVKNGDELTAHDLTPFFVGSGPNFTVGGSSSSLYSLVLVDPDAPSPDSPTAAQYLHWMWVNVPGQSVVPGSGDELVKYTAPNPPSGLHRYVFALFLQPAAVAASAPSSFSLFSTREFASSFSLTPVASLFFLAQRAEGVIDELGSEPKDEDTLNAVVV